MIWIAIFFFVPSFVTSLNPSGHLKLFALFLCLNDWRGGKFLHEAITVWPLGAITSESLVFLPPKSKKAHNLVSFSNLTWCCARVLNAFLPLSPPLLFLPSPSSLKPHTKACWIPGCRLNWGSGLPSSPWFFISFNGPPCSFCSPLLPPTSFSFLHLPFVSRRG